MKFCHRVARLRYESYLIQNDYRCSVVDEFLILMVRGGASVMSAFNEFAFQEVKEFRRWFIVKLECLDQHDKAARYESDDQQDAHEFIGDLLEIFKIELSRVNTDLLLEDDILDIHHLASTEYCCAVCGVSWYKEIENQIKNEFQPSFIPLNVEAGVSVKEQYAEYFDWQSLENMKCQECEATEFEDPDGSGKTLCAVQSKMNVTQVGETIFIQLKRTAFDEESGRWVKDYTSVEYEEMLHVMSKDYRLTAAMYVSGETLEDGHFWTARLTSSTELEKKPRMVVCNDLYDIKVVPKLNVAYKDHAYLLSFETKARVKPDIMMPTEVFDFLIKLSERNNHSWPLVPVQPTNETIIQQFESNVDRPFKSYKKFSKMQRMIEKDPNPRANLAKIKSLSSLQEFTQIQRHNIDRAAPNLSEQDKQLELKMKVHKRKRFQSNQDTEMYEIMKKSKEIVKAKAKNPDVARKLANKEMEVLSHPFQHILKTDPLSRTPILKEKLIKKLEDPATNAAIELGHQQEKNLSRRDIEKEMLEDAKNQEIEQAKKLKKVMKKNVLAQKKLEEEQERNRQLQEEIKALRNQQRKKNTLGLAPAVKKTTTSQRPKHRVPDPIDLSTLETLEACKIPTLSLSERKWKRSEVQKAKPALRLKYRDPRKMTQKKTKKKTKKTKFDKPRSLFDDKKQSKLPKSLQVQKKAVRDLTQDMMEENYASDNSLLVSAKRAMVTKKPRNINPFKKKNQPRKGDIPEEIIIDDASTNSDDTSSNDSKVR